MRIVFKTGRKPLGDVDLLAALFSFSALVGGVLFLVTDGKNLQGAISRLNEVVLEQSNWSEFFPIYLVRLIVFVPSFLAFILAWRRVLLAAFSGLKDFLSQNTFVVSSLLSRKVKREFRSFPNLSPDDTLHELEKAQADESRISAASRMGIIDNIDVWKCDWPDYSHLPEIASKITDMSLGNREYRKLLDDRSKFLTENVAASANSDARLSFLISPVQPSVLLAANRVIASFAAEGCINTTNHMLTGPQTVRSSRELLSRLRNQNSEERVVFVAPLSAFCTAPTIVGEPSPDKVFMPVVSLITERQDLLIVEGGSTTPVRKGTLFYYNNSTAEESVARLPLRALDVFNVVSVEDYTDYKKLLRGEAVQEHGYLRPGDAIVTWQPLTDYFLGRSIGAGYFTNVPFELGSSFDSRIMMFADRSIFDDANSPSSELAWAFMMRLNVELLSMRQQYHSAARSWFRIFTGDPITRNYKNLFKELIV